MQGSGERRGARGGLRRGRHRGADVPGPVLALRQLHVGAQQHVRLGAVRHRPRDAARRHHQVPGRAGEPAARPPRRVQLRRVHRRGREPGRQARPRRAAQARLPPQLRRRHR